MENIQAVLFDLDGLIVDSENLAVQVWTKLCQEQGFELREEMYRVGVGKGFPHFLATLSSFFGSGFDVEKVRERRPLIWEEFLSTQGLPRKTGFDTLLHFLEQNNYRRAIATSTERPLVERRFRASGVDPSRFHAVVTGDEVPRVKPAPDLYLRAAELVGVPPENCLALEDSDVGAKAANAAGVRVIVIPDLFQPSEETLSFAFAVKDSLEGVYDFLKGTSNGTS